MATAEQLKIARTKAVRSPGIGKRGKGKKTIAREDARAFYEAQILEELELITRIQLGAARDIKNKDERMFVINQLIGKPKEISSVSLGLVKPLPTDKADNRLKQLFGIDNLRKK